jgi:geranylgeranyl diphosphate synthase type I
MQGGGEVRTTRATRHETGVVDDRCTCALVSTTEPLDVADVRWRVERQLIEFLSTKTALYPVEDDVSSLLTPIVSLLLGSGKRLRAALCYWGWIGAGGPDCDDMIAAASALELLQGFALIHDDVMDASSMGGRPVRCG